MNSADTRHAKTRFSIRSLLTLIALAAIVFVAWKQHQQNLQMQRRLEALSSQIEHQDAVDEDLRAKLELLREFVSDEPALNVPSLAPN